MNCLDENKNVRDQKLALSYMRRLIRYGEKYDIALEKTKAKYKVSKQILIQEIKQK